MLAPRNFNSILLFAATPRSEQQVQKLKQVFDDAVNTAAAIQESETNALEYTQGRDKIEAAIKDIAAALLGRDVHFV